MFSEQYVAFNRWLAFFSLNAFIAFLLYHFEVFTMIWIADVTFISWIIMAVYVVTSLRVGTKTYRFCKGNVEKVNPDHIKQNLYVEWFVRDDLMTVGLLGTLIGLMFVLGPAFAMVDPTAEAITGAIKLISLGIGTALWTTVCGLVASLLLGIQLNMLERAQGNV